MSAIDYCINKAMNSDIPRAILEDVFVDSRARRLRLPSSVEDGIRNKVIKGVVVPDLATMGGTQVALFLNDLPFEEINNNERIYKVPLNSTQGREILRVEYICSATYQGSESNNGVLTDLTSLKASMTPLDDEMNAEVAVLANNNLLVNNPLFVQGNVYIVVQLEIDPHLATIRPAYFNPLSKLVNQAVKAYCFRELVLELDRAKLYDGREFGTYKDIVSNWSDAHETYNDLLEKWRKYLQLNDPNRKEANIFTGGKFRV